MKNTALLLLFTTLFSCTTETPKPSEKEVIKDTVITEVVKQEPVIDFKQIKEDQDSVRDAFNQVLDSIHNSNKSTIRVKDFLTSELPEIDEEKLQKLNNALSIYVDGDFMTLLENFEPKSKVDSLVFFPETITIRSFHLSFTNGLAYSQDELESGMSFMYYFPTNNELAVKNFISRAYGGDEYTWYSEKEFGPKDEEAGCYLSIKKEDEMTIVSGYCGC